jgi:hypothetical protein
MKALIELVGAVTLLVVLVSAVAIARPGHSTWGRGGGTFDQRGGGGGLSGTGGGNTCSNALIFTLGCNSQYAPLGLP